MDASPEYICARLTEILVSLRAEAERATLRHRSEVVGLREVIEEREREIRQLQAEVGQLQAEVEGCRRAVPTAPTAKGDVHTASFKKITLGKRTPKSVSQFSSNVPSCSPQLARSVLLDQKAASNHQSAKNIAIPSLKMENSQSVKFFKHAPETHPLKNCGADKQNMKIRPKKPSVPTFSSKNDRTASTIATPLPKGKLGSSMKPSKTTQRRGESKESRSSREKRCIEVLIPCVDFSAYSILAKGQGGAGC